MPTVELTGTEAEALGNALDWIQKNYGPLMDPVLVRVRKALSKAIRGY
jgi:hypothetical protein